MISPINFRASAGISPVQSNEQETPKPETAVTNPIENQASFKGAEALAAYNKAILAADAPAEEEPKAPAFKGEEPAPAEEEPKAPAFKGEEPEVEEETKAPAFKGEGPEVEEETPKEENPEEEKE